MACNPTRLELSNTAATTVNATISPDPGDGTAVVLTVPGLSISESQDTSSGAVSYTIATRTEATNSLWDATIQVGSNAPADVVVQIVATSAAQNVGVTVSSTGVTYCAPTGGALVANSLNGPVLFTAKNRSGQTITKGQVVYVSGHSGSETEVGLADADNASAMPAFGLVNDTSVNDNADVEVVTFGEINSMDTSAFSVSDIVYVSTTPGGLTATAPAGEASLIQNMGKVVRAHATQGIIKVIGAGRANATPNLDTDKMFLGNASNQSVSTALSAVALTKFSNDLSDSYSILIETPADKDYPIDGRAATARTITNFYAKTASGTCTATLKNLTDTTTIGTISVTSTGASAASLSNTSVDENDRVGITISSTSSADMLEMVVEYTG